MFVAFRAKIAICLFVALPNQYFYPQLLFVLGKYIEIINQH